MWFFIDFQYFIQYFGKCNIGMSKWVFIVIILIKVFQNDFDRKGNSQIFFELYRML